MIRCIDLGKQTSGGAGPRQFAFWSTVADIFIDYNGASAWASEQELELDMVFHLGREQTDKILARLTRLTPKWAKQKSKT